MEGTDLGCWRLNYGYRSMRYTIWFGSTTCLTSFWVDHKYWLDTVAICNLPSFLPHRWIATPDIGWHTYCQQVHEPKVSDACLAPGLGILSTSNSVFIRYYERYRTLHASTSKIVLLFINGLQRLRPVADEKEFLIFWLSHARVR